MSGSRKIYWQRLHVMGQVVGLCFVVGGGIVFLYALSQGDWLVICFTALGPIIGILLLCGIPFRSRFQDSCASKSAGNRETD